MQESYPSQQAGFQPATISTSSILRNNLLPCLQRIVGQDALTNPWATEGSRTTVFRVFNRKPPPYQMNHPVSVVDFAAKKKLRTILWGSRSASKKILSSDIKMPWVNASLNSRRFFESQISDSRGSKGQISSKNFGWSRGSKGQGSNPQNRFNDTG